MTIFYHFICAHNLRPTRWLVLRLMKYWYNENSMHVLELYSYMNASAVCRNNARQYRNQLDIGEEEA